MTYLILEATEQSTQPTGATLAWPHVGEITVERNEHGYTLVKAENHRGDDYCGNLDALRPVEVVKERYDGRCDRVYHWGCAGVPGSLEAVRNPNGDWE